MTYNQKLFSILFIVGCFFFNRVNAQNNELELLDKINPYNPNSSFQINITNSVYPISIASPIALLTTGYISKNKSLQRKGWENVGTIAINSAITVGLKKIINRQRPYIEYPASIFPYSRKTDASFPSGHTSTAFATATSLSINLKKWYVVIPAYAWATSVGYSRLYLGEHYPTDVLAGAAIGIGSAYLSNWINKKYFNQKKKTH